MSKRIDRAIREYQDTVTPEGVKDVIATYKANGLPKGLITAAGIRIGAVMTLKDILEEEIGKAHSR